MTMTTRFLMAAALAGTIHFASAADVTGKITLKGTPPPEHDIPLDPFCGKLHPQGLKTRLYVVDANGGLADTFVYLKEGVKTKSAPSDKAVNLDQKGCEYGPYVLGLQAGQKIEVTNSDPLMHNVHTQPTAAGNKEENKAQLGGGKPIAFTFPTPEVFVKFKCDVHNWMFAYVGVVDHPYFAVSGKDGSFTIHNVPPGKYVVEAYHRKAGKKTQEIEVNDKGQAVNFTLEVPAAQ